MRIYKTIFISMMLIGCIGTDSFADERLVRVAGDPYPLAIPADSITV